MVAGNGTDRSVGRLDMDDYQCDGRGRQMACHTEGSFGMFCEIKMLLCQMMSFLDLYVQCMAMGSDLW